MERALHQVDHHHDLDDMRIMIMMEEAEEDMGTAETTSSTSSSSDGSIGLQLSEMGEHGWEGEQAVKAGQQGSNQSSSRPWRQAECGDQGGDGSFDNNVDEETRRRLTKIFGLSNVSIVLGYFAIGFAVTFWVTPLQVYLVDELDASPAKVNVLMTLLDLPWSFKLFYGLLSDSVPIGGKRRKPYYLIGWAVFIVANAALALLGKPGMGAVLVLTFLAVVGFLMSDVMCDAMVVERARYEETAIKGEMQAIGYVLRYAGNILGSALGTVVYNKDRWGWGLDISQIFWLNAAFTCACALAFAYSLEDPGIYHRHHHHHSTKDGEPSSSSSSSSSASPWAVVKRQLGKVWDMVQRRNIYLPMLSIGWYNVLQVPNAAWTNFLIAGLGFDAWSLGLRMVAGTVFSWLGAIFYRSCLRQRSWRTTYTTTTLMVMAFSVLQLILIFRLNVRWGVSDLLFSVGDDSMAYFVHAAQWFPLVSMYIGLCPEGAEGMSFAMLTTFSNVAGTVGSNIGTLLTDLWDVSNKTLAAQRFDGVWKLTLLTSLLQPAGLALIFLLPRSTEHQKQMQKCERRSVWGGVGFVAFLLAAWLWTIVETVMVVLKPTT